MQHDFDITTADANTGATMRAQINAALQALATNSALSTEPGAKYPFMWWADTATDTLKQRNAANTAWVNVLTLSTGVAVSATTATTAAACSGNAATATNAASATDATNSTNATGTGTIPFARYENGLRIIRGTVRGTDGAILAGAGFTVSRTGTGSYTLFFSNAYTGAQSVLVSLDDRDGAFGSSSTPVALAYYASNVSYLIKTKDGTTSTDYDFSFIAIGPN